VGGGGGEEHRGWEHGIKTWRREQGQRAYFDVNVEKATERNLKKKEEPSVNDGRLAEGRRMSFAHLKRS
jgi:hypothetical protein